jgi:hypothetical protein
METVQGWFSGLACCNSLQAQEARAVEAAATILKSPYLVTLYISRALTFENICQATAYTVTCFDESDTELRDIRVHPTHQWKDMQVIITEIYGAPVFSVFVYV